MKLSLVVQTPGKSAGRVIPLLAPHFLIGRDPSCRLRPASLFVSNRHCAVLGRGNKALVRDLGSTNGTWVNGCRIEEETELKEGDCLQVGPLTFAVHLEGSPAVNCPTPAPVSRGAETPGEELAAALLLEDAADQAAGESLEVPQPDVPGSATPTELPASLEKSGDPEARPVGERPLWPAAHHRPDPHAAAVTILKKYRHNKGHS
jgi:predicted component of type VI protein secretion system